MWIIMIVTSAMPSETREGCCSEKGASSPLLERLDIILRISVGVFGALAAPVPFGISLGVGSILGGGYSIIRHIQKRPTLGIERARPICAQGYMIFLSGMRFPEIINSIATAVFIGAHLRHDPIFYVPFCGLFTGLWLGNSLVETIRDFSGRSVALLQKPSSCQETCQCTPSKG